MVSGGDEKLSHALMVAGGYDPASDRFTADGHFAAGNAFDIAKAWRNALRRAGRDENDIPEDGQLVDSINRLSRERAVGAGVPVTDLRRLLRRLSQAGLHLGLATSDSEEAARAALSKESILDLFDFVAGYDSGCGRKPDPAVVHAFCKRCTVAPEQTLLVGDTWHDIEMARGAGAASLAVLTGAIGREELETRADRVTASIADLPEILGLDAE